MLIKVILSAATAAVVIGSMVITAMLIIMIMSIVLMFAHIIASEYQI